MGGIFGCIGQASKVELEKYLSNMAGCMEFRGGLEDRYLEKDIAFGSVQHGYEQGFRLLYHKHLPVVAACEGEIYNAEELFKCLKNKPDLPLNAGEFSIVPYLYAEYGYDFPRLINGIFCIALWDDEKKKMCLARDHLGSHSIYFSVKNRKIFFATTVKALLSTAQVSSEISLSSLNKYLACLAISPPFTMFRNIAAVRPGCTAIIDRNGKVIEHAYWSIQSISENYHAGRADLAEKIREIFMDAVKIRAAYNTNHSCGALISGGIDTSSIVCVLKKNGLINNLKGFSIDFDVKEFSDGSLQELVYKDFDISRNQVVLQPEHWFEMLELGASFLDNPVNDVAYAGMLAAMKMVKKNDCQVVFEGEGSDEFFATGHSHGERSIQLWVGLPLKLRRLLLGRFVPQFPHGSSLKDKIIRQLARMGMSDLERRNTWIPGIPVWDRSKLFGKRYSGLTDPYDVAKDCYDKCSQKDLINIYQYGLTRLFLPDDLLYKNERMAAAEGIMNRTPFIDYRLVEEAFTVPAAYKICKPTRESDGTKLIFKDAVKGIIPDEILHRKKTRGFGQPSGKWLRGPLKNLAHNYLFGRESKIVKYLDQKVVNDIFTDHMRGNVASDYYLNSLLILELWMRTHSAL